MVINIYMFLGGIEYGKLDSYDMNSLAQYLFLVAFRKHFEWYIT